MGNTPPISGDDWGMVYYCFTRINSNFGAMMIIYDTPSDDLVPFSSNEMIGDNDG